MANKKINQLVAKTTIQSTDLFPLGDASTGQLFKKTIAELQAAIGGAVISVNGLVGTVVLDTDDIQELATPTNKYFTDARARAAISLTVTGNSGASTYSNSTGVLNVPTYTLAGLGGITASFLSGASGIAYNSSTGVITYTGTVFTDASIRALVSAGAGLSYNSSTGVFSYSGTVYTDASIRALISLTTSGSSGASTYNNTTGVLNVPTYTLAGLGGISSTFLTAGTGISYSSSTGIISYSGTVYTDSSVRGLFSATAPITYNSSTGAIAITQASTSANGFLSSTDWNTFNGKQNALTLGNVTEVASNVLMFPDGGTNKTIGNLSIQVVQSGASTNGYLSSTDWTTFNNKQATVTLTTTGTTGASTFSAGTLNIPQYQGQITLTTTGTSGAATFTSNTLNIPQYQAALTNPVTGTGTTNYVPKWTSSSALGNSSIQDVSATYVSIIKNAASITDPILYISPSTTSSASILNLDNSGAGSFYVGRQNSAGNSALITGLGASAGVIGHTGTQSLHLVTNSLSRITINGTGNVGIGMTPGSWASGFVALQLASSTAIWSGTSTGGGAYFTSNVLFDGARKYINSAFASEYQQSGGNHYFQVAGSGTAGNTISFNTAMTIANDGNIGISVTPQSWYTGYVALQLGDTTALYGNKTSADARIAILSNNAYLNTSVNWIYLVNARASRYQQNDGDHVFSYAASGTAGNTISWSNALVIKNSGNTLLGTGTDNGERLYVSGSIRATGSITANSDVRLKKNIERIENALQKVSEISGYTYNTIYDEDRHAGVIAQEIDKVLPEIVNKGNDGLMGVEYGNISALLIEAIKEQKVLIESLQAKVEALEK